MWKTEIEEVVKNKASLNIKVIFNKDGEFYDRMEWLSIQPESLNSLVKNQLELYKKIDSLNEKALIGEYEIIQDVSVDPDRVSFRINYEKYCQLKKAIETGIGKSDKNFTDLEVLIKTTYRDEYANIIKEYER